MANVDVLASKVDLQVSRCMNRLKMVARVVLVQHVRAVLVVVVMVVEGLDYRKQTLRQMSGGGGMNQPFVYLHVPGRLYVHRRARVVCHARAPMFSAGSLFR